MTTTAQKSAIQATVADNHDALTLTFSDGRTLSLLVSQLAASIAQQALVHGLKQKLVDAAAISRNPETGRSATIEDKYQAVKEVYDRILAGQWNKTREGGAGTGNGGLLFRALCRMYDGRKTPAAIREWLDTKSPAEQAALRATAKVAEVIAEIRAESAKAADVDTDSLLEGLDD